MASSRGFIGVFIGVSMAGGCLPPRMMPHGPETLDGSGAVIARNIGFVRDVVHLYDRSYFEVPLKVSGVSYRVSVTSLDWKGGGGGL
ncbi:MAG TPA: hypothetical protein VNQ54_01455 [Methylomirabilota bacterium]|nr:hypothetical protein [Methylomirabilota bacterium]